MTFRWLFAHLCLTPIAKILLGLKTYGYEHIPAGPVIFASNHISLLDPPVLGCAVKREVYFVAKAELFEIRRFFTWLISYFNAISIRRERDFKALKRVLAILKRKGSVVIFPEGTRSLIGELLPFQPGVGLVALKSRVPVVPVYIKNSDATIIDMILRRKPLKVFFSRPIIPNGYPVTREGYSRFTKLLREKVLSLQDENKDS